MKAFEELKRSCCSGEKFLDDRSALLTIWDDFIVNFERQVQDQDTVDKLSTFIRIAQNNLTVFANKIYTLKLNIKPCSSTCKLEILDVLKNISKILIKTLLSLQVNYTEYFDDSLPVPLLVIRNNEENRQQHTLIIKSLEKKNIDPAIIRILNSYLNGLHVPGDNKIKSWRQFCYMRNLIDELLSYSEDLSSNDDTMKLIRILVGFDFNPLVFYDFMVNFITNEVDSNLPVEEQELELILLLKTFDTIRPEVKTGFNHEVPTIQESISHFISKELDTLSRMKEVLSYPVGGEKDKKPFFYFDVTATIEELFFLIKVMTEVRFIKTKFKANLYSFVSRHIRTARTKNPSAQYMRNIYGPNREVPVRIIRQIRTWLTVMISFIDSNYGDKLKFCLVGIISYSFFFNVLFG